MRCVLLSLLSGLLLLASASGKQTTNPVLPRVVVPPEGGLYHGVYPGGFEQGEHAISEANLNEYLKATTKRDSSRSKIAWVYFSSEWGMDSKAFPRATCKWIWEKYGAVPFIRLMLRTTDDTTKPETTFHLDTILAKKHDSELIAWAREAAAFGKPLLVEWGAECNGHWFHWNGKHHGEEPGAEKFRKAYQRIVKLARGEGAHNITWVFHINVSDDPAKQWNKFEHYYPGDKWIDWIGVSVYGIQDGSIQTPASFTVQFDPCYHAIRRLAPDKPIAIVEFGCAKTSSSTAMRWTHEAFHALVQNPKDWKGIVGFAWWNESWTDGTSKQIVDLRIQNNAVVADVFQQYLPPAQTAGRRVIEQPIVVPKP